MAYTKYREIDWTLTLFRAVLNNSLLNNSLFFIITSLDHIDQVYIATYSTPRHVTSAWSSKLVPWNPHGDSHVMISDQLFLSYRSFDRLSDTWKSVQEGNIQAALQYYPAMHRGVWWITVILPSCILLDTIINWKSFHLVAQALL
jgi:hypothetical protein